jgi:hypothetical protein
MFKKWCADQKFAHATNLSHVLMDGGVLSVPFDKLNDFYERYIEAVNRGEKLFVVEQKSETYNFFVDLDYKGDESLTIEEIKYICKVICDKVKRHGGTECLVSIAPPKESGTKIKTGVHLNWPGLVVDQASAIALREHILIALTKAKGSYNWSEIIDAAVYGSVSRRAKGSGFRMPWSLKMAKHDACKGQGCKECSFTGKIEQLAYLPLFVYKSGPLSTLINISQKPDVAILKMSAVRTNAPQNTVIEHPSINVKEGAFSLAQTKDELQNEELRSSIELFVRKNMEGQGTTMITKIFKHNDTYLVSTTSKYCENLKRDHGSNHIWFMISGKILAQKCFCRCETLHGRRDGFCKDFYGRKYQLPPAITDKLYPRSEDIKKCPEIKKYVEKPSLDHAKEKVEAYIRTWVKGQENTRVVSVKKDVILTTSNFCETINGEHEDVAMSYTIKKNQIVQKCPVCKRNKPRAYILTPDVLKVLKQ